VLVLLLGGLYAATAQAEGTATDTVTFSCTAATYSYTGFPDANENTVTQIVKVGGVAQPATKFTFNGPTGSDTVPIETTPGRQSLDAEARWDTNGIKGLKDVPSKGGITCPPTVTTITPSMGTTAGGTAVVITGSGFVEPATVTIDGEKQEAHVVNGGEISAITTAHGPGSFEVVVSDSNGTSEGGPSYTYETPSPITPNTNSGTGTGTGTGTGGSGVLANKTVTLPAPELGVSGDLTPISGTVLVELPGTSVFVPLTGIEQVPFGTIVNAINGTVSVTTVGPHGALQTMAFYGGEFRLIQGRNGMVVAVLVGGNFSVCPTARERSHIARTSSTHASRKHVVRKLWSEGHGSYSTRGNYAAGAVLGTRWLTEDLCDGTLIHVATDKVRVTNFVNHKHVTVKAGHTYLAKAP
jgi:hypothetical protein